MCAEHALNLNFMKGFVMSGLKTFSCIVVLCGAMANTAIADPRIEARGQFGRDMGGAVGGYLGRNGGLLGAVGGYLLGQEIGDRVEDLIHDFIDREPQTREPQAPREPIRDFYDYGYSFGHAW